MRLYLRGEHHPQHARATRAAFVARDAEDLIGFIAGHLTTRFDCDGELQWLLVAPSARGGPAAALLWARLREWFVERRARRICVNVEPDNIPARRFYRRMGAEELSSHWMIWSDVTPR
jgi:ribosomal protein S18 acetylase RimI-like enzyme